MEWRKIPGFSRYSASDSGLIRRDVRMRNFPPGLVSGAVSRGYIKISITDDAGRYKTTQAHRLVASAFIGPAKPGMFVCHFDGNGINNRIENLRYDTAKGNTADAIRHGTTPFGTKAHNAKLTEADIPKIVSLLAGQRHTQEEIGRMFGVSQRAIWQIAAGQKWRHITGGLPLPRAGRGGRKITDAQVSELRRERLSGESIKSLATKFGICESNVYMIIKGTSRKDGFFETRSGNSAKRAI